MARIIGAVACSHTPTIGFAFDKSKQQDPVWAPIFEAFAPVQRWARWWACPTCTSMPPCASRPEQLAALLDSEIKRWSDVIARAKIPRQ